MSSVTVYFSPGFNSGPLNGRTAFVRGVTCLAIEANCAEVASGPLISTDRKPSLIVPCSSPSRRHSAQTSSSRRTGRKVNGFPVGFLAMN